MKRRPPGSTRTVSLFHDTTLFGSGGFRKIRRDEHGVIRFEGAVANNEDRDRRLADQPVDRVAKKHPRQQIVAGAAGDDQFGMGFPGCLEDDRSEEHTSELQSLMRSSYAVFSLTKIRATSL